MTADQMKQRVEALERFFEQLDPGELQNIGQFYAPQAYFKDPFNEVRGPEEIRRLFEHMYRVLERPHFVITERVLQAPQCVLIWEFRFRFRRFDRRREQVVKGSSHLRFGVDGRVEYHRDYWDAAEELYEKIPGLGMLMRWLRQQANR
jgi:limonene-1,2-epoxide hydrolase